MQMNFLFPLSSNYKMIKMKKILLILSVICISLTVSAQDKKDTSDVKVSIETLNTYVGKYELAPGAIIDVTVDDNRIFVQLTGQAKFEIFPSSATEFYLKVVEAKVLFHSDEKGKVTSLTLNQNGRDNRAKKIE